MEFLRKRVFTSLNADELRAGDKVITARCMADLKTWVEADAEPNVIELIQDETNTNRFTCKCFGSNKTYDTSLAYLVERKESCANCEGCGEGVDPSDERTKIMVCSQYKPKAEINLCDTCKDNFCECPAIGDNIKFGNGKGNDNVIKCKYYKPITKQKAYEYDVPINGQINEDGVIVERKVGECHVKVKPITEEAKKACVCAMTNACPEKHYRPFKDTDELIKVFCEKTPKIYDKDDEKLFMPYIWVREKGCDKSADLITCYGSKGITVRGEGMYFDTLFTMFEFLDGTPCGVEE